MYDNARKKYERDNVRSQSTAVETEEAKAPGIKAPKPKAADAKIAAAQEADRRGTDRHLFTATAEIIELSSGARFSTRTTDLGPGGCFVDTLTPFPVGSEVRVTIFRGKSQFETRGSVVYSQTGLGMGIAFDQLAPGQRQALDSWLADISDSRLPLPKSKPPAENHREGSPDHTALLRLVQILISKGVLTAAEARAIFYDPII